MPKNEPFFQRKFLKYEQCKCKCHLNNSALNSEKWGFEFKAGKPSLLHQIRKNEVSTRKYSAVSFLPKIFFILLKRPVNIYFFIISLVMLIRSGLSPYGSWIYISLLILTVSVSVAIEFWLDTRRELNDLLINDQLATKADNEVPLKPNVKWKDIQIGDILYLRKEEVCPADLIILDTSDVAGKEAFCYVDTSSIDGKIAYCKKKASCLSQIVNRLPAKNNFKEYRKLISGKIEYEGPNPKPSEFLGFLRLKKDPKLEKLTIENFVPRGAVLKYSDWVFGMVVFVGPETKIMLNANFGRHKVSVLETAVNYYLLFFGIIVLTLTTISLIILIARVKVLKYLRVIDQNADSPLNFFTHLILYSPLMPLVINSNIDIIMLVQKFLSERKLRFMNPSHFLHITDPNNFTNIAQIQYVFLDKTGTITKSEYKVAQIFFNNRLYKLDQEKLAKKLRSLPASEKAKLFKNPFLGVNANGEVLYASQNLTVTLTDKRKLSSVINSPRSPQKQPLIKISEREEIVQKLRGDGQNPGVINNNSELLQTINLATGQGWPQKRDPEFLEASNVDEELEVVVRKSQINSLEVTPHSEFRGRLLSSRKSQVPLVSSTQRKTLNLNQMIEAQSTHGFVVSQKIEFIEHSENFMNAPLSSDRIPILTIELPKISNNPNKHPSQNNSLAPPDSSLLPLNSLNSQDCFSNAQTPRSRSESRKRGEDPTNTPSNQKSHDFFYSEGHFIKDLYRGAPDLNLDYLFEALALCQASKIIEKPGNNDKHYLENQRSNLNSFDMRLCWAPDSRLAYRNTEDQVILDFARLCGFVYEKPDSLESPSQYSMRMKGNKMVYNVYGINEFSSEKKKSFSIVLKSPIKENEVFLLCKGQEDYMRERLSLESHEEEMLEAVLNDMHGNGLKPVIFGKRSLPEYEAWSYINRSRNLKSSLINQAEELTDLALELEKDLSLVCVVGLKDELNDGIDELMGFSREADLNVWMLTGDSKGNALSTASLARLVDGKGDKKREITAEDHESLLIQFRNLLTEIKNIYIQNFFEIMDGSQRSLEHSKRSLRKSFTKSIEDYFLKKIENWQNSNRESVSKFSELKSRLSKEYLVVNGRSIEAIFRDGYLKPHFLFLLALFKKVVAFNMTPRHKYLLTETVQSLFPDNPSVMAIGDGYNDALMLQTAHIGVELLNPSVLPFHKRPKLNIGDLQISSLSALKPLMLFEGIRRLTNLENFMYLLFYKSFLLGWTLFLYSWFCSFTGTSVFSAIIVFLYSFFFLTFSLVIYVFFDKPVSEPLLGKFPGLYKEALLKKRNPTLRIVIKSLVEAILHSFIIFYTLTQALADSVMSDGTSSDFLMISFALSTTIIFIPNVKILFLCLAHNLRLIILGFVLTVLLYAGFIFLASHSQMGNGDWGVVFLNLFNSSNGICMIIHNIWVCQLVSFIYERYILKKVLYSSVKEKIADINYLQKLTNEQIVKDLEIPMDIGTLVKRIFVGADSLDPSIQEMFTPADINVNEIELDRFSLVIKDPFLEQKFSFSHIADTVKKTLMIYYTSLTLFLVFVIYALVGYENKTTGFISLGVCFVLLLLSLLFYHKNTKKNFYLYARFLMFLMVAMKIVMDWVSDGRNAGMTAAVVAHVTTLNLSLGFGFTCLINVMHFTSHFIVLICLYYGTYPYLLSYSVDTATNGTDELQKFYGVWSSIVVITTITVISLYSNYKFEKHLRSEFLAKSRMEQEANNIEDILAILVPKFVKDQLSQGAYTMQESQDDIGILFCDMCDFDHIITTESMKIVQILDEIFRNFDNLCLKHGIQKIETVGKTYMACAGLKACEMNFSENILKTEKTRRLVSMAFEMMRFIEKVTIGKGESIRLKIGIHIGPVIAGVIGHHKPQFSLIGDTVNTTSRVCSTGAEGAITISDEAYQKIKSSNLEFLKKVVQAKGKGELVTYQVLKQRKKRHPKESKFKKRVMLHMMEIRRMYQLSVKENEPVIKPKNIHKAVNLMQTWYFQKRFDTFDERGSYNYNISFKSDRIDEPDMVESQEASGMNEQVILKPSNEIFLTFKTGNQRMVQQFKNSLILVCKEEAKVQLISLFAVFLFETLLIIAVKNKIQSGNLIIGLRSGFCFSILISLFCMSYLTRQTIIRTVNLMVYFFGLSVLLIQADMNSELIESKEEALLELILIYLIYANSNFLSFVQVLILTLLTFTIWIIDYGVRDMITGQNLLFILAMLIFNLLKVNFQLRHHIDSFNNLLNNESKKQEQNNLVSQLLPFHAFEKLKNISVNNKIELTDFFSEVTLLFADISGFTKYSSSVRPIDVVNMLRKLFTEFDKMCLHHKVYKVYTIGDCYVVMGFLNANHRNPLEEAKNVVKMGLSMIEIIRDVRKAVNFPGLDMRIGVHTGDIIGGIIGTDIVRYDIYGRDVLIANKMESNGLEGHIMVSETTKGLLEKDENQRFRFEKLKEVECKVMPEPIPGYLIYLREKPQINFFNELVNC